jgi:hypothetical protein
MKDEAWLKRLFNASMLNAHQIGIVAYLRSASGGQTKHHANETPAK